MGILLFHYYIEPPAGGIGASGAGGVGVFGIGAPGSGVMPGFISSIRYVREPYAGNDSTSLFRVTQNELATKEIIWFLTVGLTEERT